MKTNKLFKMVINTIKRYNASSMKPIKHNPKTRKHKDNKDNKNNKFINVPNMITILRIVLLFIVIHILLNNSFYGKIISFFLVILIIFLDGIDGYIARKLNSATEFGAVFDIAGDRIVEQVLWITFAYINLIPLWIPVIIITRGVLTDSIRSFALKQGMTAFGAKTMMKSKIGYFITASRFSRALYGIAKALSFALLVSLTFINELVIRTKLINGPLVIKILNITAYSIAWFTVALCVIRGIPVLIESKRLFDNNGKES